MGGDVVPHVTNYGLGWWIGEVNGHTVIGNYGAESASSLTWGCSQTKAMP